MQILKDYTEYLPILSKTKLFSGIPADSFDQIFEHLQVSIRRFEKDEYIQRLGEPFLYSGIVLEGTVEGSFISENYNKINMNHFQKGRSFGEALACVNTSYSPVQLKALSDCTVMLLNLKQILADNTSESMSDPGSEFNNITGCEFIFLQTLSINLIKILASQNVFSNLKLRIANQKALRDRILIYLHSLIPDAQGYVHVPFTQTALAEFLGVNRSALSRELGRMQDEELIFVDGKIMKLLL